MPVPLDILALPIPGFPAEKDAYWEVRALVIKDKSLAINELALWEKSETKNYKKIIRSLLYASKAHRCTDPKYVKPSSNAKHSGAYEALAHGEKARMMFFYSEKHRIIVCTNPFWKTNAKENQDAAFKRCSDLKKFFESQIND